MKYKDQNWPDGAPVAGETLSVNGAYVGGHLGTPTQAKGETAGNADPFLVAHNTVRLGTLMQDAGDGNFPERAAES